MRQPDDDFGLAQLLDAVYRRRWLFIGVTVACSAAGVTTAILTQPVFRATTVLIAADTSSDAGSLAAAAGQYAGLASFVGLDLGANSSLKTEAVAILGSRPFTEAFIRDLGLLPSIFADDWDPATQQWRSSNPDDVPTVADAARVFSRQIRGISEDRQTGLITLSIEWHDRETAAEWANTLVARLNEHMRTTAIAETDTSIAYLNRELEKTSVVELRQSIYGLIEAQISKRMLANVREQYALRVLEQASIPTLRERVRPQRALMSIVAAIVGGLLGIGLVLVAEALSRSRARYQDSTPTVRG